MQKLILVVIKIINYLVLSRVIFWNLIS